MLDIRWIGPEGSECRALEDLPALLARSDGFVWLDVMICEDDTRRVLSELFHFHPLAIGESLKRVPLPKLHVYGDHFFAVMHSVELAGNGRMKVFQTSTFIHESRYLVTVHGPHEGPAADFLERETQAVRNRLESGRFKPGSPAELGHAIVTTQVARMELCVERIADVVERLERTVTQSRLREYERVLDGLFDVRRDLQTLRTIAATSREVHARMVNFSRGLRTTTAMYLQDMVDHFDRLKSICEGEKELLQEILDLYQTRVANDLSHLVRKLTALGAILVADTLVAGIYGMNFQSMPELHWRYGYPFALGLMAAISAAMAWWFRRRDWL